jgi:hypothetical protein
MLRVTAHPDARAALRGGTHGVVGRGLVACGDGRAARSLPGIARREAPRGVPVQVGNRSAVRWRDWRQAR